MTPVHANALDEIAEIRREVSIDDIFIRALLIFDMKG
jgi:hypothetical protein